MTKLEEAQRALQVATKLGHSEEVLEYLEARCNRLKMTQADLQAEYIQALEAALNEAGWWINGAYPEPPGAWLECVKRAEQIKGELESVKGE